MQKLQKNVTKTEVGQTFTNLSTLELLGKKRKSKKSFENLQSCTMNISIGEI